MPKTVILVDRKSDFQWDPTDRIVMRTREYIARGLEAGARSGRVINLSRSYSYLGYGYYASLLAEVRGHRVIPSAGTILDLNQRGSWRVPIQDLEETLRRTMARLTDGPEAALSLHVYFGRTDDHRFVGLARKAFDLFRCPILRIRIDVRDGVWLIKSVTPVDLTTLHGDQAEAFGRALDDYTRIHWRQPRTRKAPRYTLAILHDPKEPFPPSNANALARFRKVGEGMGIEVDFIHKRDFNRVAEYDALFIRETTAIDHHTFRFAMKAAQEDMPVIDDPVSIQRCTNKVYLAELLAKKRIPTPRTVVLDPKELGRAEETLSFPMVLKVPDGSFSRGIYKVGDRKDLKRRALELFDHSDIILAQEFMYTSFDWRVGVLGGRPLFVCQYDMVKDHWQIYRHEDGKRTRSGSFRTLPVEDAPQDVVETALRAANLMGDGLYGIDMKQNERGAFVVEVNDNPNIDAGIEDQHLKTDLYRIILEEFVKRIDKSRE